MSYRNYSTAVSHIVDPSGLGDFTTLASAIAAAVSGHEIFIRPGTYTENLALKAGVNLVSYSGDDVTIVGKMTYSSAGTVVLTNLNFQTNSDFILELTGSAASGVSFIGCNLNATNNTAISYTSSSASSGIGLVDTTGNLGTTGITYFSASGAGTMTINQCQFENTGGSTTASTLSAGLLSMTSTRCVFAITTSSTGVLQIQNSQLLAPTNLTMITHGGGDPSYLYNSYISSGTSSAISIAGTLRVSNNIIDSTNTNAITGAGNGIYSGNDFINTSSGINTTTQTGRGFRYGIGRSSKQPAFLAYLAAQQNNKTGAGANYQLGTDALTEVIDQNGDFNTNGTFTAPLTGSYHLNTAAALTGATIATTIVIQFNTSNRNYVTQNNRPASNLNLAMVISTIADMDAADTAVVVVTAVGEAGNTDDVIGGSDLHTFFSGYLEC